MVTEEDDSYDLLRFVTAQDGVMEAVKAELKRGRKQSHWMWFVFPQLRGLGGSAMADEFGISGRDEAEAYLSHAVLGPRLRECTQLVNQIKDGAVGHIFGYPDDLKFRSCMTLFAHVAKDKAAFLEAIRKYFGGQFDAATLERLRLEATEFAQ